MQSQPRIGVVLSGGGSRGAYEAGVLLFVRKRLAQRLGYSPRIDILTGTSVGAINAAFLAATIDRPEVQAAQLCDMWRSLRIEKMITVSGRDLLRAVKLFLGGKPPTPTPGSHRYGGIFQTEGLERFVLRSIPWRAIRRNLKQGRLRGLAVSATHLSSGQIFVFIDSVEPVPEAWSHDPFVTRQRVRIGPRHVLASAAIPILLPSVKIGERFFTDGGLRQRTPMSPAIRLGADRLLVVSLRHQPTEASDGSPPPHDESYPRPLFVAGKALNALLLDHTGYDLDRMGRLNAILEEGTREFGDQFAEVMNRALIRRRGAPIRKLEAVSIRPSVDIGRLASDFVRRGEAQIDGRLTRRVMQRLALGESTYENDLLSYLLFDGHFASELIELGYSDAEAREEELAQLFRNDE